MMSSGQNNRDSDNSEGHGDAEDAEEVSDGDSPVMATIAFRFW
jgi:hypothetical protein